MSPMKPKAWRGSFPRRKPGPRMDRAAELAAVEAAPRLVCDPDKREEAHEVQPTGTPIAASKGEGIFAMCPGGHQVHKRRRYG